MSYSSPHMRSPVIGGPATPTKRRSGLQSRTTQLLALRFGWVVLVIWFEVGDFFHSLSTCRFPDSVLRTRPSSSSRYSSQPPPSQPDTPPTHVVLLADPHVPHPRLSYPPESRPWVNWIRQNMDELFMRKSWNVVTRLGRIDAVVVVGDMLDWGRGVMSDSEYEDYYALFRSIFQLPHQTPMYFVPGNHDIPLGPNRLFSPHSRDRYARHFSEPNVILPIANHSLILLDAIGLVEEDYRRYAAEMQFGEWDGVEGGVIEFVKTLGEDPPPGPRILISHIPLARPEASSCGPLRERGRIQKGAGPGYQNLLGSETSRFLLEVLQPTLVFSGDDHDYCEVVHPPGIKEVTLKSFSSSAGIRKPGFQLLSLIPPSSAATFPPQVTHADVPCFLPDQLGVYNRVYLPLAILTVVYLFVTNVRAAWIRFAAGGGSVLADIKARVTPTLPSTETMPSVPGMGSNRRLSERPVPLTLPSRKSSQQLMGLSLTTPRRVPNGAPSPMFNPTTGGSSSAIGLGLVPQSAPVSPTGSPRMSFAEESGSYYGHDPEMGETSAHTHSAPLLTPTASGGASAYTLSPPNLSRRSSYANMADLANGGGSAGNPAGYGQNYTTEPGSYFLPLPSPVGGPGSQGTGLGISGPSVPASHTLRRTSSNLSSQSYGVNMGMGPSPSLSNYSTTPILQPNPRRVTLPRMLSASDWSAAARAKDKSVIGLMVDTAAGHAHPHPTYPTRSGGGEGGLVNWAKWVSVDGGKAGLRWLWRTRNGVVAKSWRETVAIAWPAGLVWFLVNALFFIQ